MRDKVLYSVILIAVLTFLSFSSTLDNEFTNWDDDNYVVENPMIRNFSWGQVKEIFSTFYASNYHPLVFISFALEYSLFKLEPFVYHTTNLLLHISNSLLVFYLIFLLSDRLSVSLITALLFSVHPLHVESVAWVAERKDVLSTFFFLQAIIYYLLFKEADKWFYYYLSLFVFVLALLSKPMVVTLPLVLILCDYLLNREFNIINLLEKVPFFVLSIVFGIVNIFAQLPLGISDFEIVGSLFKNIIIACWVVTFYLIKAIVPFNLSAFYPYPEEISIINPEFFLTILLLSVLVAVIIYSLKWTRKVIFGSLFFIITILPVIQLIPFGQAVTADRYMYIPSIGLFYMAGLIFHNVNSWDGYLFKMRKASSFFLISIIICIFSFLTFQRNNIWQNSETMWLNVIKSYPNIQFVHDNLADYYTDQGRLDEAILEYNVALKLKPRSIMNLDSHALIFQAETHNDIGIAYAKKGRLDNAINEFKIALRFRSNNEKSHYNLGNVYAEQGRLDDAIKEFLKAVTIKPDYEKAHSRLGKIFFKLRRFNDAIREYRIALKLRPEYAETHSNLGHAFAAKGRLEDAYMEFEKALEIEETATRHWNAALAYEKLGLIGKAVEHWKRFVLVSPDNEDVLKVKERLLELSQ